MNFISKLLQNKEGLHALEVLFLIKHEGFSGFLVGGCVRDMLLGRNPKDFDIATNMPLDKLAEFFDCHDIGQSKDFGIVTINHRGFNFEVANFRVDGKHSDGRHPDDVKIVSSFREDVTRRDFTINALGVDHTGEVVDFVGGVDDLKNGVVKTVGNPFDRFREDTLRVLRAVRFAGMNGFKLDDDTKEAMKHFKGHVKVAPERVRAELVKMASGTGEQLANCVCIMLETGLLETVLPEVFELVKIQENEKWHPEAFSFGDGRVFDHVMCALCTQWEVNQPLLNLGILFHDLGKPSCWSFDEVKGNRFSGHAKESAKIVKSLCERLRFSNEDTDALVYCAEEHMTFHTIHKMKASRIVKHFDNKNFDLLVSVCHADDSCRLHAFDEPEFKSNLKRAVRLLSEFKSASNTKPLVSGNLVMKLTGEKPGKLVGDIIKQVSDEILDEDFVCTVRRIKEAHKRLS